MPSFFLAFLLSVIAYTLGFSQVQCNLLQANSIYKASKGI